MKKLYLKKNIDNEHLFSVTFHVEFAFSFYVFMGSLHVPELLFPSCWLLVNCNKIHILKRILIVEILSYWTTGGHFVKKKKKNLFTCSQQSDAAVLSFSFKEKLCNMMKFNEEKKASMSSGVLFSEMAMYVDFRTQMFSRCRWAGHWLAGNQDEAGTREDSFRRLVSSWGGKLESPPQSREGCWHLPAAS